MWRTFSVFSSTTNSLMLVASIPISAQAALGSPIRRALKAGSIQATSDKLGAVGRRPGFLVFDLRLNILIGDKALFKQKVTDRINSFGVVAQFVLRMIVTMILGRFRCVVTIAHRILLTPRASANVRRYRQESCPWNLRSLAKHRID